jgi:hypothetical protein
MQLFELVIGLLLGGAALAALSRRAGLPYPALLALAGAALAQLRNDGTIGDDAFHRVEEDLDWAELNAEALRRRG